MAQGTNETGDSNFVRVFNNSGVDIDVGRVVIQDTTVDRGITLPADGAAQNTYVPFSITTEKLYAGKWGRVPAKEGMVITTKSAAAIARGASVTSNSAAGVNKGKAITASAAAPQVGFALTVATAVDQDVDIMIARARNA